MHVSTFFLVSLRYVINCVLVKVLVACEYSGIVSAAFHARGHSVTSCDLLQSEGSPWVNHYRGNVFDIIDSGFDMAICFPPCTWLAKCQLHRKDEQSVMNRLEAFEFVLRLYYSNIPQVAIENPVGWLNTNWRPPDQITSPHYFGSLYSKEVCLWLKNLPPLIHTYVSPGKKKVANHTNSRMSGALRSKIKSKFFPEFAQAMANQWS